VAQERLGDVLFVRIHGHIPCEVVLVGGQRHGACKTKAPLLRQTHASKRCHSRRDLGWTEESKSRNSHHVTSTGDGGRSRCLYLLRVQ